MESQNGNTERYLLQRYRFRCEREKTEPTLDGFVEFITANYELTGIPKEFTKPASEDNRAVVYRPDAEAFETEDERAEEEPFLTPSMKWGIASVLTLAFLTGILRGCQ